MRAPALAVALALTAAGTAHADRQDTLSLSTGMSVDDGLHPFEGEQSIAPMVGVSLAWEKPLPPYPPEGGRIGLLDAAPELALVGYHHDAMLLAGLRFEAGVSSNLGGPRRSIRTKVRLTPRVGVSTQADTPVWGLDFGWEVAIHGDWRLGNSFALYTWRQADPSCDCVAFDATPAPEPAPLVRYLGFQIGLMLSAPI